MLRPRTAVVVGITKDVAGFQIAGTRIGSSGVYLPISADAAGTEVITRAVGAALLATPMAEQIAASVRLFDPIAYFASLACIIAACAGAALIPALRAGRVNPLAALRQD